MLGAWPSLPAGTSAGTGCLLDIFTLRRVDMMAGVGSTLEGMLPSATSTLSRPAPVTVIRSLVGVCGAVGNSIAVAPMDRARRPAKRIGVAQLLILTIVNFPNSQVLVLGKLLGMGSGEKYGWSPMRGRD